jgi:uncharacterized protein YbjT (DUF2867 family)
MMAGHAVMLAGASGLVGTRVLAGLLDRDAQDVRVVVPSRRALAPSDERVGVVEHALDDATLDAALADKVATGFAGRKPTAFACCLGSTIAASGSRVAFADVDLRLVLRLARIARALGARQALAVTSVGAHPRSRNFYLATKGEVERGLASAGFERVDLLRPGLLLGARRESRPAEALMRALAPLYNPVLGGPLRRYRAIPADTVARALVALVGADEPGVYVHENDELARRAGLGSWR